MNVANDRQVELNTGGKSVRALVWAANGEYLVSGDERCVRMWRVEDGGEIAVMPAAKDDFNCLAVSNDGKWIAGGTWGRVFLWNAKTLKKVFDHWGTYGFQGVDFSPDSTSLLVASSYTATVHDIASPAHVRLRLNHKNRLRAAKYSPTGDRIATATENSVRVWDSSNGNLLVEVKEGLTPEYNKGLFWVDQNRFFVTSRLGMKLLDASTCSKISEWHVPGAGVHDSCIALPRHGKFVAYSANKSITFWDTSRSAQPGLIEHGESTYSIALSPDGESIAMGGCDGRIIITGLSRINSYLGRFVHEPEVHIDDTILDAWKDGRLVAADGSLTAAIFTSQETQHHLLACRAIVRTRLQQWTAAIFDAKESISIRPSVIGCVAKSIALNGKGEKNKAYRAFDVAFQHVRSIHFRFLLLVKAIIVFMAGDHEDAVSRIDDLKATDSFYSTHYTMVQAYRHFLIGHSRVESGDYNGAIRSLKRAQARLRDYVEDHLLAITLIFGWKFDTLDITIQQLLCEVLYAAVRVKEAGGSLRKIINTFDDKEIYAKGPLTEWLSGFTHQCLSTTYHGDRAVQQVDQFDEMQSPHGTMDSMSPTILLQEWAKSTLAHRTWKDALLSSRSFVVPRSSVYRVVCEYLEKIDHIMEASECFRQMVDELVEEINERDEQPKWVLDFKQRCTAKLKHLGDAALTEERNEDAIAHYSAALALNPATPYFLIKRSEAYVGGGSWSEALDDAETVIVLKPLSPWGYERKHAALHQAGDYEKATEVFKQMLSRMLQSLDAEIRERHHNYVTPGQTIESIRKIVQDTIQDSPRVLINTLTGRLCKKKEQAAAFESLPVFKELISLMTTHIDYACIEQTVREYYRYAMFSHKWEESEPLFKKVLHIVVYDLEESPTHEKLQMFCKIVKKAGFKWAWSDTCCIDKSKQLVHQEAIIAMFKWYEGSSLTVVFLRGVRSPSRRGDLVKSVWNSRAWTFQEYHASKVVRFYTEDWKPYLDLKVENHKECPEIISEMEEATGISAGALMSLRPGLDDIRIKLCLASQRKTTLVEDAAYSLLGIFSVSLNVVYGEGDKTLGRLLSQLLTNSGDTSILAWTGKSGSFNSCLPADISVFGMLQTTHIPPVTNNVEMDKTVAGLNSSLVMKFYDRLDNLPVPSFAGQRMKLPCLAFKLGRVSLSRSNSEQVFHADSAALGAVDIKTSEDLSKFHTLYLIHPWIDFLLNRQAAGRVMDVVLEESEGGDDRPSSTDVLPSSTGASVAPAAPKRSRGAWLAARLRLLSSEQPTTSVQGGSRPSSFMSIADKQKQARRVITRLRSPFGALLLAPNPGGVAAYRKIVTENVITVQLVGEITPTVLKKLIDGVRTFDVL